MKKFSIRILRWTLKFKNSSSSTVRTIIIYNKINIVEQTTLNKLTHFHYHHPILHFLYHLPTTSEHQAKAR